MRRRGRWSSGLFQAKHKEEDKRGRKEKQLLGLFYAKYNKEEEQEVGEEVEEEEI